MKIASLSFVLGYQKNTEKQEKSGMQAVRAAENGISKDYFKNDRYRLLINYGN
jgi:hypothetical protein